MKKFLLATALLGYILPAQASVVTEQFTIDGENYHNTAGAVPPFANIDLKFTITFDPSVDVAVTNVGLKIDNFTVALDPGQQFKFRYTASTQMLRIGTMFLPDGNITDGGPGFEYAGWWVNALTNPAKFAMNYSYDNVVYQAQYAHLSMQEVDTTNTVNTPEPATWLVMAMGLLSLGLARVFSRRLS